MIDRRLTYHFLSKYYFDPNKHMAWPINPDEVARANGAYKQTPGW